jgi:hypothetical protein
MGDQSDALPKHRRAETQNKHTDIHALSNIRTRDPSVERHRIQFIDSSLSVCSPVTFLVQLPIASNGISTSTPPTCRGMSREVRISHAHCQAIANLWFRHMGHYFLEPSDYHDDAIRKVLHFIRSARSTDIQAAVQGPNESWPTPYLRAYVHTYIYTYIHIYIHIGHCFNKDYGHIKFTRNCNVLHCESMSCFWVHWPESVVWIVWVSVQGRAHGNTFIKFRVLWKWMIAW